MDTLVLKKRNWSSTIYISYFVCNTTNKKRLLGLYGITGSTYFTGLILSLCEVRSRKPALDDWCLPLEGHKVKYERESIRKNSTFSLPKEHVFREIITHNKPKWLPSSFRTDVRDNYVSPYSQIGSNIPNMEDQVQTYYQRHIANFQSNAYYEHLTAKERLASETSQIGTGKPICSVLDQFKEKNKRLQLKSSKMNVI